MHILGDSSADVPLLGDHVPGLRESHVPSLRSKRQIPQRLETGNEQHDLHRPLLPRGTVIPRFLDVFDSVFELDMLCKKFGYNRILGLELAEGSELS